MRCKNVYVLNVRVYAGVDLGLGQPGPWPGAWTEMLLTIREKNIWPGEQPTNSGPPSLSTDDFCSSSAGIS
jgi:hypothetical protein